MLIVFSGRGVMLVTKDQRPSEREHGFVLDLRRKHFIESAIISVLANYLVGRVINVNLCLFLDPMFNPI